MRPVLPRFGGALKIQPKATEIKVTFVQLLESKAARPEQSYKESGAVGCKGTCPASALHASEQPGEEGTGCPPLKAAISQSVRWV